MENYLLRKCVGTGSFGDVFQSFSHKTNSLVAIKVVNLDERIEDITSIVDEIQFLSRLRSDYITQYFETFVEDMSMCIVMEYCGGGSCSDLLKCHKKLDENITAFIIRDVLKGLSYLHSQKKVHRDIKSANILLTEDGKVKLADFGVSGEITFTHLKRNTFVGTPFWMAPEVISVHKPGHNEKADIWSTGITVIELLTGKPPLAKYDPHRILFQIPKMKSPTLTGPEYSENVKDFLKYCLIKDPQLRPSSSTLLHHKFVTSVKKYTSLVPLIEKKNEWFKSKQVSKKPRPKSSFSEFQPVDINWDFSSAKINSTVNNSFRGSIPMQQTLLHHKDPGSGVNEENSPHSEFSNPPISGSPETPNSGEYGYNDVLLYCLQRVKQRAKAQVTQNTVQDLINRMHQYEQDQPGISEAIVEEILKFQYLVKDPNTPN